MKLCLLPTARSVSSVVCIAALGASFSGHAEQKPLWEAGLGVGAVTFPDYRGSDRTQTYVLPVPYFVYRGEFLKADRNGVRGRFFDSDRVELNVTMNASAPVDSRDNATRQGMSDLKPTVEIGPSLDLTLWRSGDKRTKLDLRLPLVTGVTVEGSPQSTGWQFSPRVNLDLQDPGGMGGWNLGLVAGPLFGDRKKHQYFYSVAQQYATPERPAYEARRGYAGTQFLAALSKRFPSYWVGGFLRYDTLSGAVFGDSPLVRRSNYLAGGIAIAWIIGESSRMVDVNGE
ncbi:MAG: MipA/OmpV family protein [Burkholderiales bacterium]|nr:MipA/OmpV family protein [Burkholderiales bacterium]